MTRALSALVALLLLAAPAAAAAARTQQGPTNAPPGNSAIDEYLETVPSATGNEVPRKPGSKGGSVLTPAQRARLEKLGPDGKVLADAVDATAPPAAKPGAKKLDLDNAQGRSPISAIFEAAVGGDGAGMGFMLPVILLASLLGVIVLVLLRRRSVS
jgi:hypothetical protein